MNAKQDTANPSPGGRAITVEFSDNPVDQFEVVVTIQDEPGHKSNCAIRRLGQPVGSR